MVRRSGILAALLLTAVAACSDDADPVADEPPGPSTSTLEVPDVPEALGATNTTLPLTCDRAATAPTSTIDPSEIVIGCTIELLGDPMAGATIGIGTFGPLDGSMTFEAAAAAANRPIYVSPFSRNKRSLQEPCLFFGLAADEGRIGGIGGDGKLRSLHFSNPGPVTDAGVGVGGSRTEVLESYPAARAVDNVLRPRDDLYVDGTLPDGGPALLRFVFDDSDAIDRIITGAASHVSLPRGCA